MGIRIHKRMGWGTTLTQEEASLYLNEIQHGYWDVYGHGASAADYLNWLDGQEEVGHDFSHDYIHLRQTSADKLEADITSKIVYAGDDESAEDEDSLFYLLITPLSVAKDWSRWDDSLDYAEVEYFSHKNGTESELMDTTLINLPHNPFPYSGQMNAVTGDFVTHSDFDLLKFYSSLDTVSPKEEKKIAQKGWGVDTFAEAQELIVPSVPQDVANIIEFLSMLTDAGRQAKLVQKLRPSILTYWS